MRFHGVMAMVMVQDIERALRFYRDRLGFTVQAEQEEWVLFNEGVGLQVSPEPLPEDDVDVHAVMVTLLVDDVADTYSELMQQGVDFFLLPTSEGDITVAAFRDTENNGIQLMQFR